MPEPPLKRLEELFHRALALPPDRRTAYLDETCAGDPGLRVALEDMLSHDAAGPIAGPVVPRPDGPDSPPPTLPGPVGALPPSSLYPEVSGYGLIRVLGRGGMGVVYLARHVALNRLVALKMLSDVRASAGQVARFRGEAEALARLRHPNVVPIYDVGEFEGHPYFTMEYVAGPTLAARLDGRPQDVSASGRLVETLARAAHAVHQCGIVHRDLKPANVLMQEAPQGLHSLGLGVPKITDFGIARDRAAPRLTRPGVAVGTPGYMAPEQLRNSPDAVGPGADVYALGVILYEMLTGRLPFDGPSPLETIGRMMSEEPPSPALLRPRLPAEMTAVCLKCLEKSPRRRYVSALDLAEDLRRFQVGEPVTARPVGPLGRAYRWCLRRPLVAGLVALSTALALAVVITVVVYEVRLSEARGRKVVQQREEIIRLDVTIAGLEEADEDAFTALLWLADALRHDEEAGGSGSATRARIAEALGHCPRLLYLRARNDRVLCARPTASGAWVATAGTDNVLRVWDALTGEAGGRELRADEAPADGALSADGRRLATVGAGGAVRVWDVESGTSRLLPAADDGAIRRVAFPGAEVLLTQGRDRTRLWDLRTDPPAALPSPWDDAAAYAALGEDARWLFTQDRGGSGRVWDMATGSAAGPPVPLGGRVTLAAVSADGRRVALIDERGDLRVWDGTAAAWVGGAMRLRPRVDRLIFCPDGERVIAAGPDPGAQLWQVGTGKAIDLPSRKGATGAALHFSADGRLLVARQGTWARVWDLDEGRPITPPLRHGSPVMGAAFCADGRQVVTVSTRGTVRLWELSPPAGEKGRAWDDRPRAEILAWAHVLAAARLTPDQQRKGMDDEALGDEWESLRRR
ncbi:MAG TPA: serine/threonine-protein kinase [Gemmataceae bacterium]|nr:serine/threonine-protein kinase [Gemmataceae bacterium]